MNIDSNTSIPEDSEQDVTEFFSPDSSCSEVFSTASASSEGTQSSSFSAAVSRKLISICMIINFSDGT